MHISNGDYLLDSKAATEKTSRNQENRSRNAGALGRRSAHSHRTHTERPHRYVNRYHDIQSLKPYDTVFFGVKVEVFSCLWCKTIFKILITLLN